MSGNTGWFRLTLLWIGAFLDGLLAVPLQTWVSGAVLVLTVLQILVTIKKMRRRDDADFDDRGYR